MDEALLGVGHPEVAFALTCLGESYLGLRDYEAAIDVLQRANALRTENEVPAGNRAWTRWLLGRCLVESAVDSDLGMKLIQEARPVFALMGDAAASETRDVDTWLATRRES
jgi:hypothetical protein